MNKYVLVIANPQPSPQRVEFLMLGDQKQIARKGHVFNGQEGRMGVGRNAISTGWHQPIGWAEVDNATECVLHNRATSDEDSEAYTEACVAQCREDVAAQAATPEDFPGLIEHYPHVAAAYPEKRVTA